LDRLYKHYGLSRSTTTPHKDKVVNKIELIKQKREERRAELNKLRKAKALKEAENEALGKKGDIDFLQMIEQKKFKQMLLYPHKSSRNMRLCVCVRKRPIFPKEEEEGENDSISCANPQIKIFESKLKVDGITKYVDQHVFTFDNTFNEQESTEDVYRFALEPSLDMIFNQGMVTIFAYGQTSSGKTYTMQGIQENSVKQLFKLKQELAPNSKLKIAFYEIYGGSCFDLLNEKAKVQILEDKHNNVVINGLVEEEVTSEMELIERINFAFEKRTTYSTVANNTSSRSHAICRISVMDEYDEVMGKLIVCDLAGSERAQDTKSNSRQRRIEGANINKSLLALKECIRAMDSGGGHVPFRASKLTLSLRDSFKSKRFENRLIMIACVCPGNSSSDHTLNTLRYADRLKSKKTTMKHYGKVNKPEPKVARTITITYTHVNVTKTEQRSMSR
jgi:kinesin family protein 2/24